MCPYAIIENRTRRNILLSQVEPAHSFISRLRGLMFCPPLPEGHGLWLYPCQGVHMCFMRYPIDVMFLARDLTVVRIVEELQPWCMVPYVRGATSAIETTAGYLRGRVEVGDKLGIPQMV